MVVVLGFYISSTAKVIRRRDLGLKSHPKDCEVPRCGHVGGYNNDPKFSDRQVWANSADPDQTAPLQTAPRRAV